MTNLNKFLHELELVALWKKRIPLNPWYFVEGQIEPADIADFNYEKLPLKQVPCLWGGYDRTGWFFHNLKISDELAGEKIYLYIETSESLLFVNGQPYQGMDENHKETLLFEKCPKAAKLQLALEAYSGRTSEQRLFRKAELRVVNETGWKIYWALFNAVQVLQQMDSESSLAASFNRFCIETAHKIDARWPGSQEYEKSLKTALDYFEKGIKNFTDKLPLKLWTMGHSHIDVAWLWTIKEVKRKCGRTFSTALRLLEEYKDFHFVQSQPQLYAFTKDRYPLLYEQIKTKVREGRWEPVGGMWVEADCNVPNGESLVRQILYGKRFFEKEFGVNVNTLWLPDVFGYSWALPQILKKSEIDYFFTAKLAWNDHNEFPYNVFWWQGVDGTKLLSYLTFNSNLYNSHLDAAQIKDAYTRLRQKLVIKDALMSYGYGDGGGGVTREELENRQWLKKSPALPQLKNGSVKEFFNELANNGNQYPTWADELYFERHRGTYTSRAQAKRDNRKCEIHLRDAEIFSTFVKDALPYPKTDLQKNWQNFLTTQFHDIIPGSSIPDVYAEAKNIYHDVLDFAIKTKDRSFAELAASIDTSRAHTAAVIVFNTLSWIRTDIVRLTLERKDADFHLVDAEGRIVPHQILKKLPKGKEILFVARDVPPMGYAVFSLVEGKVTTALPGNTVEKTSIVTPFFKIEMNNAGQITRLFDKKMKREMIPEHQAGNTFETFYDFPNEWEAWDIDADATHYPLDLFKPKNIKLIDNGPVCTIFEIMLKSKKSKISQIVLFYHDLPRIDFSTKVDWHERRTLLKVAFPVNVAKPKANYEIQFGAIERNSQPGNSYDEARFEVPAQRWADISSDECGISLLNDCKYGCDAKGNRLRLTLLRSSYSPNPNAPGISVDYGAPADEGEQEFLYSIYPHSGTWQSSDTPRRGYELNSPLHAITQKPKKGKLPGTHSFIEIKKGASIIIETLKMAEDSEAVILRLFESKGHEGEAQIDLHLPFKNIQECNLMERNAAPVRYTNKSLAFKYKPYEIKTFILS